MDYNYEKRREVTENILLIKKLMAKVIEDLAEIQVPIKKEELPENVIPLVNSTRVSLPVS